MRWRTKPRWDRDSGSSPYGSLEHLVSNKVIWCHCVRRFPSNEGIKQGYPHRNRYFTTIGSSSVKTVADRHILAARGVARNLIWVGINCTISNLSWVRETKQPHKKFKVDRFEGGYISRYTPPPSLRPCLLRIIASTANELSNGTNIDDLERPWTPKIGVFSNFFSDFMLHYTF